MKISKNKYKYVLFDGCHKFYLIKDNKELANIILDEGFSNDIYTIDRLPELYEKQLPAKIYQYLWHFENYNSAIFKS